MPVQEIGAHQSIMEPVAVTTSSKLDSIPLIDVGALHAGSAAERLALSQRIGRACRDIGFFYVTGHGVERALMDETFAAARTFFALSGAEKEAISIHRSPHNRGYVPLGGESLDPSKPADLKEAFNMGLDLSPDDPEVKAGAPFRGVNLWPRLPGFAETMRRYFTSVWGLGRSLHQAFALDLGLPATYFDDKLDRPMATLRLLHYPPALRHSLEGQLGAGAHTDYGNVTLLATDDVGGLEVRVRAGGWVQAPPIAGTFVCNIGDCLMRWSNDTYVSTPHRVVHNKGLERYSIAFFLDPNPDAVVAPLPGTGKSLYPPITGAEFLASRLAPTYAHGLPKN